MYQNNMQRKINSIQEVSSIIERKLITMTENFMRGNNRKIEYIVIHDTQNKQKGQNQDIHYKYFNSQQRNQSQHYFVDDNKILQIVDDKDIQYHVGDQWTYYKQGKIPYPKIMNTNSIGIELCVNQDSDYNIVFNNQQYLQQYLLKKYNLPFEKMVRHFDQSTKNCPQSMSQNNWQKWNEFKQLVQKILSSN